MHLQSIAVTNGSKFKSVALKLCTSKRCARTCNPVKEFEVALISTSNYYDVYIVLLCTYERV